MTERIELLPCPFCGESLRQIDQPRRRSTDINEDSWEHSRRDDCPLGFGLLVSRVGAWNRRTAETMKEVA